MKRMKKLMAAFLACVMLLSLSVTALASEPSEITPSTTGNLTLNTTINATGVNEGDVEDKIVALLPAITEDTFKMYLDPNGLVAKAQESDSGKRWGDDAKVSSDTYVYFRTSSADEEGGLSYSNKSGKLTIGNKSNVPLVVDLEVKVDKNNNDAVKFVDDLAKLKGEDGEYVKNPAMYLAMTSEATDTEEAILAPVAEAEFGLPTFDTTADSDKILLMEPKFQWASTATEKAQKAFAGALASGSKFMLTTSTGKTATVNCDNVFKAVTDTTNNPMKFHMSSAADVAAASTTIDIKCTDTNKEITVATVTFFFNKASAKLNGAGSEDTGKDITITPWDGKLSQKVESTIQNHPDAYTLNYGTGNTYSYEANDTIENSALPSKTFQLTAGINPVPTWDGIAAAASPINVKVIWKIQGYVETVDPVIDVTEAAQKAAEAATFKVTHKGDGQNGPAVALWKVTYPDSTKTAEAIVSTASDALLQPTGNPDEYTLKCESKIFTAGTITAVFIDKEGGTFEVPLTIK